MGHRIGAGLGGDLDQPLRDQRPGDRGAEQIEPFVERVGAEHREDEVADEFLAHILDIDVLGLDPEQLGLGARRLQLFALAEIGGEGDHLAAVFGLQPLQDDRGIQPAGIGEHDLLRGGSRHGPSGAAIGAEVAAFPLAHKQRRGRRR